MTDLRADLIVVSGKHFAFSNYQAKPNGTYMVLPLQKMFSIADKRFIIPMSCNSNLIVKDADDSELQDAGTKKYVLTGVIGHSICNYGFSEYNVSGEDNGSIYIPRSLWSLDARFSRSKSYHLESAANAGLHIYDDVAKIYKEAFKACGHSNPPFYVGNIQTVTEVIDILNEQVEIKISDLLDRKNKVEEEIAKSEIDKNDPFVVKTLKEIEEDMDFIRDKFLMLMDDFPKTFGLKVHDAV